MNDKSSYYKLMFISAAVWNWIATVAGLSMIAKIKTDGQSRLYSQLFFMFAFLFGVAYWLISRDLTGNRLVVKLGVAGKLIVFLLSLRAVLAGKIPPIVLVAGTIDLVYVGLFIEFLTNKKVTN